MSLIIGILAFTLPVAVIIFIISTLVRSVRKDKTEENFQNIIRTMYVYIIMIIFLIMIVGSIISMFDSTLDVLLPEIVNNEYDVNSSTRTMNRSIASLTSSATLFCISVPLFVYYSKLAKKEHLKISKAAVQTEEDSKE